MKLQLIIAICLAFVFVSCNNIVDLCKDEDYTKEEFRDSTVSLSNIADFEDMPGKIVLKIKQKSKDKKKGIFRMKFFTYKIKGSKIKENEDKRGDELISCNVDRKLAAKVSVLSYFKAALDDDLVAKSTTKILKYYRIQTPSYSNIESSIKRYRKILSRHVKKGSQAEIFFVKSACSIRHHFQTAKKKTGNVNVADEKVKLEGEWSQNTKISKKRIFTYLESTGLFVKRVKGKRKTIAKIVKGKKTHLPRDKVLMLEKVKRK